MMGMHDGGCEMKEKKNREIERERGCETKRKRKQFEAVVRRKEREQFGAVVDFALTKLKQRRFRENERKKKIETT